MFCDDENSISDTLVISRLSVNTRLSAARIFDEDSNSSMDDAGDKKAEPEQELKKDKGKGNGKIRTLKQNAKRPSPYKSNFPKKNIEYETDPVILERRQKQIDYGKNTKGYDNYRASVPPNKRTSEHPRTPVKYLKYSRRGWDSLIRIWRMKLHEFDPKDEEESVKIVADQI